MSPCLLPLTQFKIVASRMAFTALVIQNFSFHNAHEQRCQNFTHF